MLELYTDGSCFGNGTTGALGGVGVWFVDPQWRHLDVSERLPDSLDEQSVQATNNKAELWAIIRALDVAPRNCGPLTIITDSKYAVNCLTVWYDNFERNGWVATHGGPVANKWLIQRARNLVDLRFGTIFQWVPGHSKTHGNDMAHELARQGALRR